MEPIVNLTCPCGHTNKYLSSTAAKACNEAQELLVCTSCANANHLDDFKEGPKDQELKEFEEIFYDNQSN